MYTKNVKRGLVRQNSRQVKVAKVIDDVLTRLKKAGYTKSPPPDISKHKKIQGLYIHGTIGCGKTMMLNIFYDLCQENDIPCKRVHFHEFILDVHVQLHKLRKQYGSIPDLMEKVLPSNSKFRNDFNIWNGINF